MRIWYKWILKALLWLMVINYTSAIRSALLQHVFGYKLTNYPVIDGVSQMTCAKMCHTDSTCSIFTYENVEGTNKGNCILAPKGWRNNIASDVDWGIYHNKNSCDNYPCLQGEKCSQWLSGMFRIPVWSDLGFFCCQGNLDNMKIVLEHTFNKTTSFQEFPVPHDSAAKDCRSYCNNEPRCKACVLHWYTSTDPDYQHTCKLFDEAHESDDELFYDYVQWYFYKLAECDVVPLIN